MIREIESMLFRKGNRRIEIRFITDKIVNIFLTNKDERRKDTIAIERKEYAPSKYDVKEDEKFLILESSALKVRINKDDLTVAFLNKEDEVINEDYKEVEFNDEKVFCYKKLLDDHFYGFGEKAGYLDKKGEDFVMWNTDEFRTHNKTTNVLYASFPFFIGLSKKFTYGIFFDNSYRTYFDMGKKSEEYYFFGADGGQMNYYFIFGDNIKEVVENYTFLTGRMELPPLWALGYQQSRYSYEPAEKVLEIAKTFREKDIPCDVIYLDIHYMDGYRVFTWNKEGFSEPKKLLEELKKLGFKVVIIVDPGVKRDPDYKVYKEGIEGDYFVKDKYGITFVGKVWPGEACFPDFFQKRVRDWWGEKLIDFIKDGIDGIWNDMNEPSVFDTPNLTMPEDNIHILDGEKVLHKEVHNLYGLYMAIATKDALLKYKSNERPFILTRSGFSGIQRYSAIWTGDNRSLYEHLLMSFPMIMNMGLSGVTFAGADVGGFVGDCDGELFIRWLQAGIFIPFLRNHSALDTRNQEPWAFGEIYENIARKYIKMRYEFLPYIYDLFYIASKKGYPVMRPLVFEYQEDENTHNLYDEFLLGESFLVAPIYLPSKTKREVYLPKGVWYDYWQISKYEGEDYYLVDAPIDRIPLFVKEGSIIVKQEVGKNTEDVKESKIIEIYGGREGKYIHYEDDGKTMNYKNGEYNLYEIKFNLEESVLRIDIEKTHSGYQSGVKKFYINLRGFPPLKEIFINEKKFKSDERLEVLLKESF
ncbi:MAG: alpha-glucosidase [Dictyoglomus sp. NZ13-RE01]|nr:MAG: alpha-glucosidase [Dictyoglomus sp. NZ13-RE01]